MSDFSKYTNYNEQAGVSGVVFGAKSPVIECEMNEVQEVQRTMLNRTIRRLLGNGISNLSKITYDNGAVKIGSDCAISVDGIIIECTGLSVTMSSGTAYLQVWEDVENYTSTLKKQGNQQSGETVTNYFKDSRTSAETTRRKVVKYTLATSQRNGAHNLAIASVSGGNMKKLCKEINLSNLADKVIDLRVQLGTLDEGVIGIEVDLDNNTFKRIGDNELWSPGSDYDTSPIYGERKRCNITDDGEIVAFYGDEAYTESGALTVAVTGTNGSTYAIGTKVQAVVIQPAYYYKRIPIRLTKQTHATYKVKGFHLTKWVDLISPVPREGFKLHPAFEGKDFYVIGENEGCIETNGTYDLTDEGSLVTSYTGQKFSSIANAKPASGKNSGTGAKNLTRAAIRTMCANRGGIQMDVTIASSEQMLFLIEYAGFNAQAIATFGEGVTNMPYQNDVNDSVPNPPNTTLGNGSGKIEVTYTHSNGTSYTVYVPVYRGVKNFFGNIWKFIDGFLRDNQSSAFNEACWQDGSKPLSDNIADYIHAGFSCATSEGYAKAIGYSEDCDFMYMTSLTGGDSSRPIGDYYYVNMSSNVYIALLGASWDYGLKAGLLCWGLNIVASGRGYGIGGRFARKSGMTIVAP